MRVLCIEGHEGLLEEGGVYSVREITERGNYILWEVQPPHPYVSFDKERFVHLREEEDVYEEDMGATGIDR